MNKQGEGKIEWCDYTWSPVTGCRNSCRYCYARRIATRFAGSAAFPDGFEPTLHVSRMMEPARLRAPRRIFACAMADLFGPWVPDDWIAQVLTTVVAAGRHTFYFLTKYPERYADWAWPRNAWMGVSVTDNAYAAMAKLEMQRYVERTFVSVEPLLGEITPALLAWAGWVIIGSQTGPGAQQQQPKREWVTDIIQECDRRGIPVFVKSSLAHVSTRQEWPQGVD
jgi:protein gp37